MVQYTTGHPHFFLVVTNICLIGFRSKLGRNPAVYINYLSENEIKYTARTVNRAVYSCNSVPWLCECVCVCTLTYMYHVHVVRGEATSNGIQQESK